MTVLLWGTCEDAVIASVERALAGIGITAFVADCPDIISIDLDGHLVRRDGASLRLADVKGILVRPSADAELTTYARLATWTELTSAVVFNRLSAGASNRSKPYQMALLGAVGFEIPSTLITTDPEDVRAFCAEHKRVIYKSVSGVRSIVNLVDPEDGFRLEDVRTCPTQFQQYIAGVDYRVHVVGHDLFAIRIESVATDYRYATFTQAPVQMSAVALPAAVAEKCQAAADSLGLGLAGIDLRVDAEGKWWCFEVNTSPGFTWFENQTGQPIAAAVARMMAGHA